MEAIIATLARLSGVTPTRFIHAPFHHEGNITPYASLKPSLDYDFSLCEGEQVALFASRDKAETLGLLGRVLAHKPKGLSIFWENDAGGKGLKGHLEKLGCVAHHDAKHHARLAFLHSPQTARQEIIDQWLAGSAPKIIPDSDNMQAEAGLFSYRSVDVASALLLSCLPETIKGTVADYGCGWGYLSKKVVEKYPAITSLTAIDDDLRAVQRTAANINDTRLDTLQADILHDTLPSRLDNIIMNPPFHIHGKESRAVGQIFIEKAAAALKPGGMLYMVANRHLPYEAHLTRLFSSGKVLVDKQGFKVIAAQKGK